MAEDKDKEVLLSREQVDAVQTFATALYTNAWTPLMSNMLLQNLNNNAQKPTPDSLRKALQDYRNQAQALQGYTEFARVYDFLFARVVKSYANALSFDLQISCTNAYTKEDYESKQYLADKKHIDEFLTKFDYQREFRNVVEQILTHEVYYTWFRKQKWGTKGIKYALQVLPQDRCMLTGYWEHGMLFDFDMAYFLQAGVDIDGFDPIFKTYYQNVFGENDGKILDYRPSTQFDSRKGAYATYTQTSPQAGAWIFKFDSSNFNTAPFLAPYLVNALTNDEIEQLQYNKDFASAYAILAGEIGLFDGGHSGEKTDQMKFNPKTLGAFMGKAKAGLTDSIKLAAMPLQNLKWNQFQNDNPKMYSNQLQTSASIGFPASRVLYADDRMSNAEIEGALTEVYNTMKPLYYQFNNFLNFFANQGCKQYKFSFEFVGSPYQFERQARFDNLMKMADKGLVLAPSAWSSALGIHPVSFENMLRESKYSGWLDKYSQLMVNANTASGDSTNGRPREEGSVGDSTEASREML